MWDIYPKFLVISNWNKSCLRLNLEHFCSIVDQKGPLLNKGAIMGVFGKIYMCEINFGSLHHSTSHPTICGGREPKNFLLTVFLGYMLYDMWTKIKISIFVIIVMGCKNLTIQAPRVWLDILKILKLIWKYS